MFWRVKLGTTNMTYATCSSSSHGVVAIGAGPCRTSVTCSGPDLTREALLPAISGAEPQEESRVGPRQFRSGRPIRYRQRRSWALARVEIAKGSDE